MKKVWFDEAWADYLFWQTQDKKTLKKLNKLVEDAERNPYEGLGKPEPLKHNWAGWWSRQIDETNRFIYRIKGDTIEIAACKSHYNDK